MTTQTHVLQHAGWRSDAARLRSFVHSCSTVTANAYGMKPAGTESAFVTIDTPRRGAPPQ